MSAVSVASATSGQPGYSQSELIDRFSEDFKLRPEIYWGDMLVSAVGGWLLFALSCRAAFGSWLYVLTTLAASFVLLRAALFIHELAHVRRGQLPHFETVWNILVGVPFQVPSLMYVGSHMDHHRRSAFGTAEDPEYSPVAKRGHRGILAFALTGFAIPFLMVFRWGILGPLSWLVPPLRKLVIEQTSTLVINTDYRRPAPRGKEARRWAVQEIAAGAFFWLVVAAVSLGWLSLAVVGQWFFVAAISWFTNQLRTLVAHGYENEGEAVDADGQLLDSVNLRGSPLLTVLVAPVGLRFHALHHHLPGLPYHSLARVHRRLMAEVPADSPYRKTQRGGVLSTLRTLWNRAGELQLT